MARTTDNAYIVSINGVTKQSTKSVAKAYAFASDLIPEKDKDRFTKIAWLHRVLKQKSTYEFHTSAHFTVSITHLKLL